MAAATLEDLTVEMQHLERAHILGQRRYLTHIQTHFQILKFAAKGWNA